MTSKEGFIVNGKVLFELSWEICNKVGGIYSVITSKAALINSYYDEYYCIGPYFKERAEEDFSEEEWPEKFRDTFLELEKEGVRVHYGTWIIKGEPKAILLEFNGILWRKDELKKEYWEHNRIDSFGVGWDFEEPMLFSYAAAILLLKLEGKNVLPVDKTILHVHEWMTGFAVLELKRRNSKISTVFTTHATILGRSFSSSQQNFYVSLGNFNPEDKARELGINAKFSAERATANNCDIFTTVSEITAHESEIILGRKPEVLVLNGLDMGLFPSMEGASIKHVTSREFLREMISYTFFPYYEFDLSKNIMFFLAGRYEFENKGIDIFIQALGRLNDKLKEMNSERTITVFFFMAMGNLGVKMQLLENKSYYRHISNFVHRESHNLLRKMVNDFISKGKLSENLFNKEFVQELKKDAIRFKREGSPVLCTHKMHEPEEHNKIISTFRSERLNNMSEDKVKVILIPAYLDGNDALLNLEFYDVIAGCHLGVFPSYYEPWGYTPLEAGALGVPAITTDLAGFGRFIKPVSETFEGGLKGIYILHREGKAKHEVIDELFKLLYDYSMLEHSDRVKNKLKAKELADLADWNVLIKNYFDAHNLALKKEK